MRPRRLSPLLVALALTAGAAPAAAATTHATVRVEGLTHTLFPRARVTLPTTAVVKDGDPAHGCFPNTAAGALEAAAKGDWRGTWAAPLGYSVDAIGGEAPEPKGAAFALWVDNVKLDTAVCATPLRKDANVLLFVNPAGRTLTPLSIKVPRSAVRRHTFTVTVYDHTTKGKASREAKASVYANGTKVGVTDKKGRLKVRGTKVGNVSFYAAKTSKARSAPSVTRIRKR
jgi:hypothetical protein